MGFVLPRIMGHRGVAGETPENTLVSLKRAAEVGLTWVEFDAMLTGDDVPVLFHDDTLQRTTGAAGRMADTDIGALEALEAGAWFDPCFDGEPLPRLVAAVATLFDLGLRANIEIKPSRGRDRITAERVMATLNACWPADGPPPLMSSFSVACVEVAQAMRPDWPRALVTDVPAPFPAERLVQLGCVSYHCNHKRITAEVVAEAKAAGYGLACFTVNEPEDAERLIAMGVDCLITDHPRRLKAFR